MGLGSEREEEVCVGAGQVREMGKIWRRGRAWGRRSACLLCLPSLAGARWLLNAPETQQRRRLGMLCVSCDILCFRV